MIIPAIVKRGAYSLRDFFKKASVIQWLDQPAFQPLRRDLISIVQPFPILPQVKG
jgi:hypothetical protein